MSGGRLSDPLEAGHGSVSVSSVVRRLGGRGNHLSQWHRVHSARRIGLVVDGQYSFRENFAWRSELH